MVSNKSLDTFPRDGYIVMDMGDMEIWDGADLALIREMFTRLVDGASHKNVGIDMSSVKYIPSGFFGLLFDWFERGIGIRLYDAQPHVRDMMWFRQFFVENSRGCFELTAVVSRETSIADDESEIDSLQDTEIMDPSDSNDQMQVASLTS